MVEPLRERSNAQAGRGGRSSTRRPTDGLGDFDRRNRRTDGGRQLGSRADSLGEYAMCEVLREIIAQEQEHAIDLATALGIDVPPIPEVK